MKAFVLWLAYLYKDIEEGHLLIVSHNDAISALTYTSLKNCEYVILSLEEILNAKP
jgi:hypothetical protein